ncbi:MAG: hypothetical protein NTY69_00110 [Methylococcales bacterium]|nr:hypothetical protein [Methylococcales bacterium]
MIRLLALIVLLLPFSVSANDVLFKDNQVACIDKESFEKLLTFVSDKDNEAFIDFIENSGKCSPVPDGLKAIVDEYDLSKKDGIIKFRARGFTKSGYTQRSAFN